MNFAIADSLHLVSDRTLTAGAVSSKGIMKQKCFSKNLPCNVSAGEVFVWESCFVEFLGDIQEVSEESNQNSKPEQEAEQEQEQPDDPIVLLCNRLGAIEAALGIGNCEASPSSLMNRLGAIEQNLTKNERERNLPESISWEEAGSLSFMRRHNITLEDINSGRVKVTRDKERGN